MSRVSGLTFMGFNVKKSVISDDSNDLISVPAFTESSYSFIQVEN